MEEVALTSRARIKSGDLLIWSSEGNFTMSDIVLTAIRFFTLSDFAHVGIAWRSETKLFVIDATMPRVRMRPIVDSESFYHIPMGVVWTPKCEEFLMSKVGLPYSFVDALCAQLGITLNDDEKWQCAEIAHQFYLSTGLDFGKAFTPTKLVNAILQMHDTSLYKVRSLTPK